MRRKEEPWQSCALCERLVPPAMVTKHHLTPREKGGTADDRTPVCRPCHKQIHAVFGNADLARSYATIAQLRAAPELVTFIKWIQKQQPESNFRTEMSNSHPLQRRRRNRR